MMANTPQDELPRDAHLLAALRHAPDRDAAPPPEVTARILATARAAVAAAPKASVAPAWQRLVARLVQPRIGAAFGTLAVAMLVGLLWATREPAVPEPAPQVATPARGVAASAAVAAAPEAGPRPPLPETAAADATTRVNRRPAAAAASRREPMLAKQATPAATSAEHAAAAPAVAEALPTQAAPPLESTAAAVAERRAAADAVVGAATGRSASAAPAAAVSASNLLARSRQEAAAVVADPLARIDALLGSAPPGLAWQHAGRVIAHGDDQRQWWATLQAGTQGRWRRDAAGASDTASALIELREDGRGVATWWLDGSVLRLRDGQAQWWSAPITEAQRRDWQAALALW